MPSFPSSYIPYCIAIPCCSSRYEFDVLYVINNSEYTLHDIFSSVSTHLDDETNYLLYLVLISEYIWSQNEIVVFLNLLFIIYIFKPLRPHSSDKGRVLCEGSRVQVLGLLTIFTNKKLFIYLIFCAAHEEEHTKAEFERQEKLKESSLRASMENEISSLKSEISSLRLKGGLGTQDDDRAASVAEINRLKKLLEEERGRADLEGKKAEAEKIKAAEAWKIVKAEKAKADKEKKTANLEGKKAGEYKLQLEILKKEVDEARSKAEGANKRCEIEKEKAAQEKRRADLEISKAEEQRKLAKANEKKAMVEKSNADHLSKLLEEGRQKIEKLQKEIDELVSSGKRAEALAIPPDESVNTKALKTKARKRSENMKNKADDGMFVKKYMNSEDLKEKVDLEKQKVAREKKNSDLETAKAKLAKANRKKAMKGKSCADQLLQQLKRPRPGNEALEKGLNGLVSSENLVVAPAVRTDMDVTIGNMKLLKRKLKFERMQVKYAKQMAKLEKDRNKMMQQELLHLKQHFVQFAHHLDMLDNCFSHKVEVTNNMAKVSFFTQSIYTEFQRCPSHLMSL